MPSNKKSQTNKKTDEVKNNSTEPTEAPTPTVDEKTAKEAASKPLVSAEELLAKMESMENQMREMQEKQIAREKELDEREAKLMKSVEEMKADKEEEIALVAETHKSKIDIMRDKLAAQPTVRMYLPLEGTEKAGQTHPVTINGLRLNVPKGVRVDVPQQVADILDESFNMTQAAGQAFRLDVTRESKEGITTDFALN